MTSAGARFGGLPPGSPTALGLPADYVARAEPDYHDDTLLAGTDLVWQPEVYEAADYLLRAGGRDTVIDIGCGNGGKLVGLGAARRIGIDFGPNLAWCREHLAEAAEWREADLSGGDHAGLADLADARAVVVCADVIEHLVDPLPLTALLRACWARGAVVLTSTPDRIRVRGRDHRGPPPNRAHVREWALAEYVAFLAGAGLPPLFAGRTLNNNLDRDAHTVVTLHDVAVERARTAGSPPGPPPVALLGAGSGASTGAAVLHLLQEGCDIVAIGSPGACEALSAIARASPGRVRVEPAGGAAGKGAVLDRKREIAADYPARWLLDVDADERPYSPFPETNLAQALACAGRTGAAAVDFTTLWFRPDGRPAYGSFSSRRGWLQPSHEPYPSLAAPRFPYRFLLARRRSADAQAPWRPDKDFWHEHGLRLLTDLAQRRGLAAQGRAGVAGL